jgi:predicted transcriptional regulator
MSRIFHFGSPLSRLGPLERRVLEAVWECRSATVRELIEGGHLHLAYTTVMTTLDRLFKKNLLTREAEGRAFRYAPSLTREELYRQAAGEAYRQLLNTSSEATLPLSHLVEVVTEGDAHLLDDLSRLVEAKRRELRNGRESRNGRSGGCEPRDKEKP